MKVCPQCNRIYREPETTFCLDDGNLLNDDSQPTLIAPYNLATDLSEVKITRQMEAIALKQKQAEWVSSNQSFQDSRQAAISLINQIKEKFDSEGHYTEEAFAIVFKFTPIQDLSVEVTFCDTDPNGAGNLGNSAKNSHLVITLNCGAIHPNQRFEFLPTIDENQAVCWKYEIAEQRFWNADQVVKGLVGVIARYCESGQLTSLEYA